jgi:hypothetical protein
VKVRRIFTVATIVVYPPREGTLADLVDPLKKG